MWERTNVTNLLRNRQSGKYYAREWVNGKQKWRTQQIAINAVLKTWPDLPQRDIRSILSP
jgi:hypothetical protein